ATLADANESRDWRIYADFAQVLISIARPLYADDPLSVELNENLYALDSTTIDLCLSLFPWAWFRRHKAAVKMHTLLDLHGSDATLSPWTGAAGCALITPSSLRPANRPRCIRMHYDVLRTSISRIKSG